MAVLSSAAVLSLAALGCDDDGTSDGEATDTGGLVPDSTDTPDASGGTDSPEGEGPCVPGCEGSVTVSCDAEGASTRVDCAESGQNCLGAGSCGSCSTSCSEGQASWCPEDGSPPRDFECDATQGMVCNPEGCVGACSPASVVASYVGCDYYPTVTLNSVWNGFSFAVAVANGGSTQTEVTVTRGETVITERTLDAQSLEVIELPWIEELKGGDSDACGLPPSPNSTRIVTDGAYRLRSTQPVSVYQFSPFRYQLDPAPALCPVLADCPTGTVEETACLSFSNDASLLWPATTLTGAYTVHSWPSTTVGAGFVAITATEDGTSVRLNGAAGAVGTGAGVDASGQGTVSLNRGDVLQVLASQEGEPNQLLADLSGMRLRADKPIQVIGGHSCGRVPDGSTGFCDHLEQALPPDETVTESYVLTLPLAPNPTAAPQPVTLRLAAVRSDTTVRFSPEVSPPLELRLGGAPAELTLSGDSARDVLVTGDAPFSAAYYLWGQTALDPSAVGDSADPSMSLLVPIAQYRREYIFIASDTYDANYVNVVAQENTTVLLDGASLDATARSEVGDGWGVWRVRLERGKQIHTLNASAPVGLSVYGYGRFTSYMYPGGQDLARLTVIEPI